MSMNWLEGMHPQTDGPGQPMAAPVFAGHKLVVAGGSSGMGRQAAADVVAAGGSAVIIGQDAGKVGDTVQACLADPGPQQHRLAAARRRRHHRHPPRRPQPVP